jgi:hypothetical protein
VADRFTLGFAITYLDRALEKEGLRQNIKESIHLPVACYLLACKVRARLYFFSEFDDCFVLLTSTD